MFMIDRPGRQRIYVRHLECQEGWRDTQRGGNVMARFEDYAGKLVKKEEIS
jgi:hypothetical protein